LAFDPRTNEIEVTFFTPNLAQASPINSHGSNGGNAATAPPFPYAARAVFPSTSIRRASTQRK
jgi:hypothetical protein